MVNFAPLQLICVGVVGGVATWHGRIMLHVMVVMYDHLQGTKMANLSHGA